jgi:myo-inositol-1(or 4)-monophosphatase
MELILGRIQKALEAAATTLSRFVPGAVATSQKSSGRGPVTEADRAVNRVLREALWQDGEGWLSEESTDNRSRLGKSHVWVVDPLDGTLEFMDGTPEWCVSIGWVVQGCAVAGGIYNPVTRELFLGSLSTGVTYNGKPVHASKRNDLSSALVLASRKEFERGEWDSFRNASLNIRPTGSVAYKLALVAAGLADATWTLCPKSEWDVAAGVALVESAGGFVQTLEGSPVTFNQWPPLLSGLVAGGSGLQADVTSLLNARRVGT